MKHLVFSPAAEEDLLDIAAYIGRDDPARALSFVGELKARCADLSDFPEQGRARQELRPGLRSIPSGRYIIFYRVSVDLLRIERILHGARNIGTELEQDQ